MCGDVRGVRCGEHVRAATTAKQIRPNQCETASTATLPRANRAPGGRPHSLALGEPLAADLHRLAPRHDRRQPDVAVGADAARLQRRAA